MNEYEEIQNISKKKKNIFSKIESGVETKNKKINEQNSLDLLQKDSDDEHILGHCDENKFKVRAVPIKVFFYCRVHINM